MLWKRPKAPPRPSAGAETGVAARPPGSCSCFGCLVLSVEDHTCLSSSMTHLSTVLARPTCRARPRSWRHSVGRQPEKDASCFASELWYDVMVVSVLLHHVQLQHMRIYLCRGVEGLQPSRTTGQRAWLSLRQFRPCSTPASLAPFLGPVSLRSFRLP